MTESGEQAFPTMHMRTEGGTHELIVAAKATRHQTWLLLERCGSHTLTHTQASSLDS